MGQIRVHKSKQKPFVFCCAAVIMPRIGEDGFQIVVKLSACQISGIRGEGFGKLHIKVLLTQGYPGEKIRFSMLVFSVNMFVHQRTSRLKLYEHDKDDSLLKTLTNYTRRKDESQKKKEKSKQDKPNKVCYYCY